MRKFYVLLSLTALSACGAAVDSVNSDASAAKLQKDTARYFETSASNVEVGNFVRQITGTAYKARVGGTLYNCHYFKSAVTCEQKWRPRPNRYL